MPITWARDAYVKMRRILRRRCNSKRLPLLSRLKKSQSFKLAKHPANRTISSNRSRKNPSSPINQAASLTANLMASLIMATSRKEMAKARRTSKRRRSSKTTIKS